MRTPNESQISWVRVRSSEVGSQRSNRPPLSRFPISELKWVPRPVFGNSEFGDRRFKVKVFIMPRLPKSEQGWPPTNEGASDGAGLMVAWSNDGHLIGEVKSTKVDHEQNRGNQTVDVGRRVWSSGQEVMSISIDSYNPRLISILIGILANEWTIFVL